MEAAIARVAAIAVLAAVAALGFAIVRRRVPQSETPEDARWGRVVAALQLVAEEHTEALELEDPAAVQRRLAQLDRLLERTAALARDSAAEAARIEGLRARVLGRDFTFASDTRALVAAIVARTNLPRAPRALPERERGRALYAQACAACHAADGSGRSPIAETMDPPPANVLHPQVNWSPYEMYNRITWGGAETAMPAFDEGLSAAERWDIVFFLFAERWPACAEPQRVRLAGARLDTDDLALAGDFELGNRFFYGAAACLRRDYRLPEHAAR